MIEYDVDLFYGQEYIKYDDHIREVKRLEEIIETLQEEIEDLHKTIYEM